MLANCTMADNLGTARVQADLCNLTEESKRTKVFLYTGIVYSLAFLSVALRIAGKIVSKRLALDDCIVITAWLLTAVPLGCVLAMTEIGFGEHLWNLEDGRLLPILRLCKFLLLALRLKSLTELSLHILVHLRPRARPDQSLSDPFLPRNL